MPMDDRMAVGRVVAMRRPRAMTVSTGTLVISETRSGGYWRIRSRNAGQSLVCRSR